MAIGKPLQTSPSSNFGPMRSAASTFNSILAFAQAAQGIPLSMAQGVALDKLISDAHPPLRIPTLEQVLPRL